MTVSVAASDVRYIIDTDMTDAGIDRMIAAATRLVENCSSSWSDAQHEDIIEWVAAHLIASGATPAVTSEKLGDAQVSYQRAQAGQGLKGTHYGQTAILLDTTGCLERLGKTTAFWKVLET